MRAGELWAIIQSIPAIAYLATQLFFIYIGWWRNVRKARNAFEAQLVSQGLSEDQARAMSEIYVELKNAIQESLWGLMRRQDSSRVQ